MLQAILFGLIQGLTEFLPVSSSGHLTIAQFFWGTQNFEANLTQSIILHFGTLLAVIYFFRADLIPYFTLAGWLDKSRLRIFTLVVSASIPTAVIGLGGKKHFEQMFASPKAVCTALFVTGLILILSEKISMRTSRNGTIDELPISHAIAIGIAQGLAVAPGISRSGATIAAGLLCGMGGKESAKFSFLLMIPAVGGATILEMIKVLSSGLSPELSVSELALGGLTALTIGLLSLKLLIFIINKQKLSYFAYYLFSFSFAAFTLISFHGIQK